MKRIQSLRLPYGSNESDLASIAAKHLGIEVREIENVRVIKKSLDARNRKQFFWDYSLDVFFKGDDLFQAFEPLPQLKWNGPPPLILGAGPAGLFAAWTLIQHGITPLLFERGQRTHERMRKISLYWRKGILDEDSNVCNGEGGAGTFSDGKLITRIKSPHIGRVMEAFVGYGAPSEITYVYNPHVGSNLIREVIRKMSDDLISKGADLRFNTKVERLKLSGNTVEGVILSTGETIQGSGLILACGHSAGPFFGELHNQGVKFEPKSFALGLRIEHPQSYIDSLQYGRLKSEEMEAAQYKLAHHWDGEKVGVYTFCMCPGGYVISSTTDPETAVVNGMSNRHRNSPFANAAIVCSVSTERIIGDSPFKMMTFQRQIEKAAYGESNKRGPAHKIPVQHLEDFLKGKQGPLRSKSSCPSGVVPANFTEILPDWIYDYLCKGLLEFDRKRRGFSHPQALLHGVESRTSSPVRMPRDEKTLESVSTQGLFPCGEGPGYAGGITSAAVDGINAALAWIKKFSPSAR